MPESAASLASRVQLARELLRRPGNDANGVLGALYDIVLGPVTRAGLLRDSTRLIIVPHGVLTYLPFAALLDSKTGKYVAEQHALLHLATSAALPVLRRGQSEELAGADMEVFAPVPDVLPATRDEAEGIRKVMRGSTAHIGARATEGRLREALQRGGIVHVATHATLNSRNPLFSHIQLVGSRNMLREDDGRLELHELLGLRLNATLVFLSGCETAVGGAWSTRFDTGEDYATIGQTFLFAGAQNVVATLWRIDDVGAAEFAKRFYEARSGDYVAAIATAQRQMINDARYGSPYYWAAYQVSGSGLVRGGAKPGAVSDKR
jgi:CHAT domain-containing protein